MTHPPTMGLGTYALADPIATVAEALRLGYRLVDTAASYGNEEAVGRGIAASGIPRDEIRVTSKLRGADQGRRNVRAALEGTLTRLGVDHLDLYLIHWPLPRLGLYGETFAALLQLRDEGLVREVGVSNFEAEHLEQVIGVTGTVPAVNQVELHPWFPQPEARARHASLGIRTQSWSPLGRRTDLLADPVIGAVAEELGATPAQAVLAWHLALGCEPLPKTDSPARLEENLAAGAFRLSAAQIERLASLGRGRIGGDPRTYEEF